MLWKPMKRDEKLFCELYLLKGLMTKPHFLELLKEKTQGRRDGVMNGLIMCLYQKEAKELFLELNKKYKVEVPY